MLFKPKHIKHDEKWDTTLNRGRGDCRLLKFKGFVASVPRLLKLIVPVFQQGNINELPEQPEYNDQPEWCKCGVCIVMPTQAENKCCTQTVRPCITTHPLFYQIVLDPNILDIAMRYKEDVLAMEHPRNNENFHPTAYRQFVLWQHGKDTHHLMVFTLVFDQHGCKIIVYCSTVIYSTCKIQLAQPQSTFEYYECHTRIRYTYI